MKITIDSIINSTNKFRINIELNKNNYTKAEKIADTNLIGYLLDVYKKQEKYILGFDLANRNNLEEEKEFFQNKINN